MVLYHAITSYHLLEFITHKLFYNKNKYAILIIPEFLTENYPSYRIWEDNNVFNKIIVFPYRNLSKLTSKNKILQEISRFIKDNIDFSINEFEEIHVAGAQYYFTLYLIENNIPFFFYEEGSGLLSNNKVLSDIVKNINIIQHQIAEENNMYNGNHRLVIKKYCNINSQQEGFYDPKAEHYDVVESILKLPEDDKYKIINFFLKNNIISIDQESVLLLTQQFANLKILSFEDQILIYQLFVDYFLSDKKLVIKTHPDDILYYSKLFPDAKIIREKFPSEILPVLSKKCVDCIATISSTAIKNISNYYKEAIYLGEQFIADFKHIHKYYTVLELIDKIGCQKSIMVTNGVNNFILETLQKAIYTSQSENEEYKNTIYIIDKFESEDNANAFQEVEYIIKSSSYNDIIFFINSTKEYYFHDIFNKQVWDCITPICINKSLKRNNEVYADLEEEVIYFYSKNERFRKMAEKVHFSKELTNTGIEISVKELTSEQRKIKALEGILEATEKRLLYYMNLVEEYEKRRGDSK